MIRSEAIPLLRGIMDLSRLSPEVAEYIARLEREKNQSAEDS